MAKKPYLKLTDDDKKLIKKYKEYICNTGGNDIVDLMSDPMVNIQINMPLAAIQMMVYSQILMLKSLSKNKMLGPQLNFPIA